ncbi:MAG: hypothetical protein AAGI01_03185 [Myxococcota bacterium]
MSSIPTANHERVLYARIIVSIALFSAFFILGCASVFTEAMGRTTSLGLFALLIGSFVAMPREPIPRGWDPGDSKDTQHYIRKMNRVRTWLTMTRVVYFLLAVFTLFGLPKLIG